MAIWLESEESLSDKALDMFGIDKDRFAVIHLEKNGAAEVALDRLEAMLESGVFEMAVINSLKCLTPSTEFEANMGQQTIGLQARMFGKLMRKIVTLIAEHNCALVMTNHLSTQIGVMHGDPMTMTGGLAIRFASMLTLDFRKKSVLDGDPVSKEDCMKIGVGVKKNHCRVDRMPYLRTDIFVRYGVGTERSVEIIELAEKCGILTKKGSWYREYSGEFDSKGNPIERILEDGTKAAWNGMKNAREYILTHPEYFEYLVNKVENFGTIDVEAMSAEEIAEIEKENLEQEKAAADIGIDDVLEEPDTAPKSKKKK